MGRPATGRTSKVVRVPTDIADALAARAKAAGMTAGAFIGVLLDPPLADDQCGTEVVFTLPPAVHDLSTRLDGGRCTCSSPTLSKVVTNLCTTCKRMR